VFGVGLCVVDVNGLGIAPFIATEEEGDGVTVHGDAGQEKFQSADDERGVLRGECGEQGVVLVAAAGFEGEQVIPEEQRPGILTHARQLDGAGHERGSEGQGCKVTQHGGGDENANGRW